MTTMETAKLVAAEVRRRNRRKWIGKFVGGVITSALISLIGGWEFMLAVGVARAEWLPTLPTIGYWWAVLLVILLQGVFARPDLQHARSEGDKK